jgi:hypothetical protein
MGNASFGVVFSSPHISAIIGKVLHAFGQPQ